MGDDTRKDRLLASLACVMLAAMLGGLASWAWTGVGHASTDHERFADNWRAQNDIKGFSLYLIPIAGLLTLGALALLGLAAWIPMAGKGRKRRRRAGLSRTPM